MGESETRGPMKINHWGRARQFIKEHKEAEKPLRNWKRAVIESSWTNFQDIKTTFNTVDWYEGAIIFDIGGNKYRLIAICRFEMGRVYIDKTLTHTEYEKGTWKQRYDSKKS
jgi:mRNA interferase HigB